MCESAGSCRQVVLGQLTAEKQALPHDQETGRRHAHR
jgi:hypothetical protein